MIKTPEPGEVNRDARFDPDRVDRVIRAFCYLRHTKGEWAGQPLKPDPWQVAYVLAPIFGWVERDGDRWVRCIRDAFVEVPARNGKTTLSGGIALYLTAADGEPGAEVVAAATSERQAGFVFNPVKALAQSAPGLKGNLRTLAKKVLHPASGSLLEVIAAVADAQHGANLHGAIIDEIHVHKTPDLIEVLEKRTGSRRQPLIFKITTSDDGRAETIYARNRTRIEQLAKRVFKATSIYGVIWGVPEDADPFAEETWKRANPGYGISPTRRYLEQEAAKAKNSPAELAVFQRINLGIRTKQQTKYVDMPVWDRNAGMVDESGLSGLPAFGGLDLSSTSDLCALAWLFPDEDGGFDALWRHWCPEAAFDALNKRTAGAAAVWRREGHLTVTPGNVADYDYIRAAINSDRERFDVQAIGYDRWNASQLVNDLTADEAPMVQVGQGYASMSAPLKQIKHLLLEGMPESPRFRHGGNPLMRWQTENLAVQIDAAGNVKPDKKLAGDKIDGWSAAVDAMAMAMAAEPVFESAYESGRLEVV